jgi:heme/copper-type cytochrome/quinol oxidase subunit 2
MEGIVDLHHDIMFVMFFIIIFVTYILFRVIVLFNSHTQNNVRHTSTVYHHTALEVIWTIIPALILIWIAVPSFALLYSMDYLVNPTITFKVIGHQWYWSYEIHCESILGSELTKVLINKEDNASNITAATLEDNLNLKTKKVSFDSYMVQDNDLVDSFLA